MKDLLIQLNNSQTVTNSNFNSFAADYFESAKNDDTNNYTFKEAYLFRNKITKELKTAFVAVDNEVARYVLLDQNFKTVISNIRAYRFFSEDSDLRKVLNTIKPPQDHYIKYDDIVKNCYYINSLYDPSKYTEPFFHFLSENSYSLVDLNGECIVANYYTIIPLSLKSENFVPKISLLVCGGEHDNRFIDVYDTNGNLILSHIIDIRPKSEFINYTYNYYDDLSRNVPFEREITELDIITEDEDGKRDRIFIPVKALYSAPTGEYDFHKNAIDDHCDWELINSNEEFKNIKSAIIPMAKTIAEKHNQSLNRILAAVPIWNILKEADKPLSDAKMSTPLTSFTGIDNSTQLFFRRNKLSTVEDLLQIDITKLETPYYKKQKILSEALLLKLRLIKTFELQ